MREASVIHAAAKRDRDADERTLPPADRVRNALTIGQELFVLAHELTHVAARSAPESFEAIAVDVSRFLQQAATIRRGLTPSDAELETIYFDDARAAWIRRNGDLSDNAEHVHRVAIDDATANPRSARGSELEFIDRIVGDRQLLKSACAISSARSARRSC
jgi:hypothetical protein